MNDMPKEREIPGYFKDIEDMAGKHFGGAAVPPEGKVPNPVSEQPDHTEKTGPEVVKTGKRAARKRKTPDVKPEAMTSRAYISDSLYLMLCLFKLRERHIWSTNRSHGDILEEAFCHYLKSHDREAYDDFVAKGLIK